MTREELKWVSGHVALLHKPLCQLNLCNAFANVSLGECKAKSLTRSHRNIKSRSCCTASISKLLGRVTNLNCWTARQKGDVLHSTWRGRRHLQVKTFLLFVLLCLAGIQLKFAQLHLKKRGLGACNGRTSALTLSRPNLALTTSQLVSNCSHTTCTWILAKCVDTTSIPMCNIPFNIFKHQFFSTEAPRENDEGVEDEGDDRLQP